MPQSFPAALTQVRSPINALLRTRVVSGLVTPRRIDDYLEIVDPAWSVRDVRARVIDRRRETADAVSVQLRPNENWRGFRAGQFVELSVRAAGVRHTRCFSLSSAPEDGVPLRITIRLVPGGRVSTWAISPGCVNDVVDLSPARGDFVLPDPIPRKLLFLSGGSGITPIVSMIRHLVRIGYEGDIACLHYARREILFAEELQRLARRCSGLRTKLSLTGDRDTAKQGPRHFSRAALEEFAPDWAEREAFLCGPAPLSKAVVAACAAGLGDRLHLERFVALRRPPEVHAPAGTDRVRWRVRFAKSGRETYRRDGATLLEQAESAGLRPAFGCRMGICHTCTCRKVLGAVRNELTGAVSGEPDEDIQLCVSTPQSDVTLDL